MRNNNRQKGQESIEFALIGGLVFVVALGAFMFLGKKFETFFNNNSATTNASNSPSLISETSYSDFTDHSIVTYAENPKPPYTPPATIATTGDPTNETPQLECTGEDCSINFGDYVLDGIPADFTTYVKSTGSSGGTESLAAALERVAEKADIDENTRNLIKELANSGYNVASVQKTVETSIQSDTAKTWDAGIFSAIEEGNAGPYDNFLAKKAAVETMLENSSTQDKQNIKAIIGVLTSEIVSLNKEFITRCKIIESSLGEAGASYDDSSALDQIFSLKPTGQKTDLDSAIICQTGNGESVEGQCG